MQQEIKAREELSLFVEGYWSHNGLKSDDLLIFPDGTLNVLFATKAFRVNGSKTLSPGCYLIPLLSSPVKLRTSDHFIGIRYKAFSAKNLIKQPKKVEDIVELNSLTDKSRIVDKFQSAFTKEQDLSFLMSEIEETAYDLIADNFKLNLGLRDKVNYILDRRGDVKIADLCKEFGISRQAMHKAFVKNIGLGAKELAGIWRLNHFFTSLIDNASLTEGALDAGFYDQAHGINTFKQMWGTAPGTFLSRNSDLVKFETNRMANRFSNYYDPEIT